MRSTRGACRARTAPAPRPGGCARSCPTMRPAEASGAGQAGRAALPLDVGARPRPRPGRRWRPGGCARTRNASSARPSTALPTDRAGRRPARHRPPGRGEGSDHPGGRGGPVRGDRPGQARGRGPPPPRPGRRRPPRQRRSSPAAPAHADRGHRGLRHGVPARLADPRVRGGAAHRHRRLVRPTARRRRHPRPPHRRPTPPRRPAPPRRHRPGQRRGPHHPRLPRQDHRQSRPRDPGHRPEPARSSRPMQAMRATRGVHVLRAGRRLPGSRRQASPGEQSAEGSLRPATPAHQNCRTAPPSPVRRWPASPAPPTWSRSCSTSSATRWTWAAPTACSPPNNTPP